jgi:putative heme-binding domain-containing protein
VALASVSLWRDAGATSHLLATLQSGDASLDRIAAEALGRIGQKESVPALLTASGRENDRVLEHSLTYALIEIDDPAGTAKGLQAANSHEQRTALIALDQMDGGGLKPESVAPLMSSANPLLRQTAKWIAGHHSEWGQALAGYFRERLSAGQLSAPETEELENQLAQFASSRPIQELMGALLVDPRTPPATRGILLETVGRTALPEPPSDWVAGAKLGLNGKDEKLLGASLSAARSLSQAKTNGPDFSEPLLRIAHENAFPAELRLEAMATLRNGLNPVEPEIFTFLCASVDPAQPVKTKGAAAGVLAKAKLTEDQLVALADILKNVGPLELLKMLSAFEHSTSETVGLRLVANLKSAKSRASLRPDLVKTLVAKYPEPVQRQGQELLTSLDVDSAKQSARLEELLAELKPGDIRRGQALFNSPKAACSSCHTIGYLGGNVGPDLTTIGQVRTERDLLESIVFPSASFVRSYEPFVVKTKSDDDYSGVLRKDAPDEVVLATGPGTEVRIARADIVEMRPGTVSVMPAGLADQLSRQELADLLAFLKATKWGPN